MDTRTSSGLAVVARLSDAVNRHDLEAMAQCFAVDFVNDTPAHPARSFRGRDQVSKNWTQIFAGVPDLGAKVVDSASAGDTVWTEWEMSGMRLDGTTAPHARSVHLHSRRRRFHIGAVLSGTSGAGRLRN